VGGAQGHDYVGGTGGTAQYPAVTPLGHPLGPYASGVMGMQQQVAHQTTLGLLCDIFSCRVPATAFLACVWTASVGC
jgi:hypothetical protein